MKIELSRSVNLSEAYRRYHFNCDKIMSKSVKIKINLIIRNEESDKLLICLQINAVLKAY